MTSSILETGDGLFGTHVCLEDVNTVIRDQMKVENELLADSQMEVIGDGNGFSSCVILISCNWSSPSPDLPTKLILKIVSFVHIKGLVENARREGFLNMDEEAETKMRAQLEVSIQKMHNQEINFYEILKGSKKDLLTPKVYFTRRFDDANSTKGFIGMEYLEGSTIRHNYENCTIEEVQPILKAIAGIQAMKISKEEFQKIDNGSCFKETIGGMLNEEMMKGIFENAKRMDPDRFSDRIERIQGYGSKILNIEKAFNLNNIVGISRDVLVHGDLWAANILWTNQNKALKILDYQMTHVGNPAEDLVRFLSSTLSGTDRQNNWERILEQFYGYYLEALEGREAYYTLDQLKKSYRLLFPVCGLALLPLFGPVIDMKLRLMDEEKAKKYRNVVMEKVDCLLEDVEKYYLESEL